MKTIATVAAIAAFSVGAASASECPKIGDKFEYGSGRVVFVEKVDCRNIGKARICFRNEGATGCEWVPRAGLPMEGAWIIYNGKRVAD